MFDAVIVGSGPSGSLTAYRLALAGWKTLIVERETLPRYKVCGGGVTRKAIAEIPFDVSSVFETVSSTARITLGRVDEVDVATPPGAAICVMRDRFDAFLAAKAVEAGADLWEGVRVDGIDGQTLQTSRGPVEAKVIVGADGAPSRIARALGLQQGRRQTPAIEAEVVVDQGIYDRWRGLVLFDFGSAPGGYGWIFPKADHLSIGLCSLTGKVEGLRDATRTYVTALVGEGWQEKSLKGHLLATGGPNGPIHKGNALLVGDAAGLTDPFTGEGIYAALRSARAAAWHIDALLAGRIADLSGYDAEIAETLGRDYRLARRLGDIVYRHPRAAHRFLVHNRHVARQYIGVISGEQDYRSFLWRSLRNPVRFLAGYAPA